MTILTNAMKAENIARFRKMYHAFNDEHNGLGFIALASHKSAWIKDEPINERGICIDKKNTDFKHSLFINYPVPALGSPHNRYRQTGH